MLTFRGVQSLSRQGADAGTIAGATGLARPLVADYLAIVAEEAHTASRGR